MKFVNPLYLILFISLVPLLVIYFLKPTFKNKEVSSTYIWKESLKYGKVKKGIQLNNIIALIIQILILLTIVVMAATPKVFSKLEVQKERVMIVDNNAYMMAKVDGETRFERAIGEVKIMAQAAINNKEKVTVAVLNGRNRMPISMGNDINTINQKLDELKCTFGNTSASDGILEIKKRLSKNTKKKISYFSSGEHQNLGDINYVDVSREGEFNVSILSFRRKLVNNYWRFEIDLISTGANKQVQVTLKLKGANSEKKQVTRNIQTSLVDGEQTTLNVDDLNVYEFDEATVNIRTVDGSEDALKFDNKAVISHGRPDPIKVQYYSTKPNNFMQASLRALRNMYANTFDLQISEPSQIGDVKTSGFDYYIFEHFVPNELPTDGKVFLLNPNEITAKNASRMGITLGAERIGKYSIDSADPHAITNRLNFSKIKITKYRALSTANEARPLAYSNNECVMALSKDKNVVVATINLHNSDLALLLDFPILMNNIFSYFIPKTMDVDRGYQVGDKIKINSRYENLTLEHNGEKKQLEKGEELTLNSPEMYTITEKKGAIENVYKVIPRVNSESIEMRRTVSLKNGVGKFEEPKKQENDIFIILAGIIVGLIFIERILTIRKRGY